MTDLVALVALLGGKSKGKKLGCEQGYSNSYKLPSQCEEQEMPVFHQHWDEDLIEQSISVQRVEDRSPTWWTKPLLRKDLQHIFSSLDWKNGLFACSIQLDLEWLQPVCSSGAKIFLTTCHRHLITSTFAKSGFIMAMRTIRQTTYYKISAICLESFQVLAVFHKGQINIWR